LHVLIGLAVRVFRTKFRYVTLLSIIAAAFSANSNFLDLIFSAVLGDFLRPRITLPPVLSYLSFMMSRRQTLASLKHKQWSRPSLLHGVDTVTLGQVSLLVLPLSPVNYHSINTAWSSVRAIIIVLYEEAVTKDSFSPHYHKCFMSIT